MGMTYRSQIGIVKSSLNVHDVIHLRITKSYFLVLQFFIVTIMIHHVLIFNIFYILPGWHAQIHRGSCKFEM
jgi:hypothetical protein